MKAAALIALIVGPAAAQDMTAALNDYPTVARADYVFVCMATNGETRPVLERCSCAIDTIASIIPYATYEAAEAILAMQQAGGERASLFRDNAAVRGPVADLRRAQAEAEVVCFE